MSKTKINIVNEYDPSALVEWLNANKQYIVYGFAVLIVFLLVSYKVMSIRTNNTETDYLNAGIAFQNIQSSEEREENITQLEAILSRLPDLHAKYDAEVAQTLIIAQDVPKAIPFAESLFARTANEGVDYYHDYGQITLLVASEQYESALSSSVVLKEKMQKESNTLLYGYNLIRIAFLQQALKNKAGELQAWNDLQNYDGYNQISALFNDGKASLASYIDNRKSLLR